MIILLMYIDIYINYINVNIINVHRYIYINYIDDNINNVHRYIYYLHCSLDLRSGFSIR